MHDLEDVARVGAIVRGEGRAQGRVGEVPVLPGGTVVQRQRGKGILLAESGAGAQLHLADAVIVRDDDRLGFSHGVHQEATTWVLVGAVSGDVFDCLKELARSCLRRDIKGHHGLLRRTGHLIR